MNELSDRIAELESKMQLLEQQVEHSKDMHRLLLDDITRLLTRHDHILVGSNGDSGLVSDVKMLKDADIIGTMKNMQLTMARWGGAITFCIFVEPFIIRFFFGK